MPNHVHALIRLREEWTLSKVLQNWKTISSKQIGALLGSSGRLWQPEYFDRLMRDTEHMNRTIAYIENNPVVAGLCTTARDYLFSSARRRKDADESSALRAM
jgi:REP element-mobilizing transposase RayT